MSDSTPEKYWAFISYSSKDRRWAEWLHRRIENYPIPDEFRGTSVAGETELGEFLRPVFRDRDELSGSAQLGPAIEKSLRQSRYLIVLCSQNSAQSEWVDKEIREFRAIGSEDRILALILDGQPNASSREEAADSDECFPPSLRYPHEPLAGDLRKHGDGKERGFLKIISGITQIEFDHLYRRHERRQRQKRTIAALLATTLILTLSGLTIYALMQRTEATKKAVAEQKAREASDSLVAFMIEDLYEELRKTGRLNAMSSAVEKVQDHQASNPTTPAHRLRTGLNHVSILFETGHLKEATSLGERLLEIAEGDASLKAAPIHLALADYYGWQADSLDKAIRHADQAIAATAPGTIEHLNALRFKGDALRNLGRLTEARDIFQQSIDSQTSAAKPGHELILAHDRLGEVFTMMGNEDLAQDQYFTAYKLTQQALLHSPDDREWQCDQAILLSKLEQHPEQTEQAPAVAAHGHLQELVSLEFANARWRHELAKIKRRLATSNTADLDTGERIKFIDGSIKLLESLLRGNPNQPVWRAEYMNSLNAKGALQGTSAEHQRALEVALREPRSATLNEIALQGLLQLIWKSERTEDRVRRIATFEELWAALPEVSRGRAQNLILYLQFLLEKLPHEPDADAKEQVWAEARNVFDLLKTRSMPPGFLESLETMLAEARLQTYKAVDPISSE